ncbi:MAG: Kae1-associated serine/threonine protein kinase [Candidatus Aenigmarchaeota archaeon]|nr:Kae1-associated serine/threonine protein kinase [Candidatus Aenigmarchaeota archaeon]MBU5689265.1 Kae1-associated serine/threonine protein kinase [Candidatus Aenigmarchaeota archaeon]
MEPTQKFKKNGAEALIYLEDGFVIKERIEKRYRIREIDQKIRRLRTSLEANLIAEVRRHGVNAPVIIDVDKDNFKIKMSFIEGIRIKEYFYTSKNDEIKKICLKIGEAIGRMHSAGIVHGDLTTSNMIFKDGEVYFIDFGLGFFSKRIEDFGTDLKLLKEALQSTHFKILKICWDNILKGYKKEYKEADKVIEKVKEIEKRARYAQKQE